MKSILYLIALVLLPIILMIAVNENARRSQSKSTYKYKGLTTINTKEATPDQCTWQCHANTDYCKKHHVKYLKPYLNHTDQLYFGIINGLQTTGEYQLMNVLIFVVFIPVVMLYLIIRILYLKSKIRQYGNH